MTPKLTLTTPLGIFGTAVFVRHWNDSVTPEDSIRKEFVRTALISKNDELSERGLATLYHIINDRLHDPHEQILDLNEERLCIIAELRRIAMFLEKGPLIDFSPSVDERLLIEQALDEIECYFKSRFEHAELGHIKMPYYYSSDQLIMPETTTQSFGITATSGDDGRGDVLVALTPAGNLMQRMSKIPVVETQNEAEHRSTEK
ncbi:MAG TPA: hypothetical protein VL335_01910 [Candidatus Paceibacterota bacterium]|jgi:hypothetical protein|nr:hypothetical protein [Candidatus Paceibacterota bacterium]